MPAAGTFYRWAVQRPEFREEVARAREASAHALVDRVHAIAMDATEWRRNPRAAKTAIRMLQWLAARRNPKAYGR